MDNPVTDPEISHSERLRPEFESFELDTRHKDNVHALTPDGVDFRDNTGKAKHQDTVPTVHEASAHLFEGTRNAQADSTEAQLSRYRWNSRLHFAALCYSYLLEGWNDGSLGPLLPRIQRQYKIGFDIVSLLFVFSTVGFIGGAMSNVYLNQRLGFGKLVRIGALFQLGGYAFISPGGPFPTICAGVGLAGFGIAMQMAQANGFVGSLKENTRVKFGILHASYGLGAFVSPLVATHFSTASHWSFHYVIAGGIAVSNVVLLTAVFRLRRQDDVLAEAGQTAGEANTSTENVYHQILRLKEVHLLSIFCLIYVGIEVTLGGWIVTFIVDKRGGGATAGYISSGFFGGLMLGRLILMWLNQKIGERRAIMLYGVIAIGLEVTVWVVPSLLENAIAVSFVGLLFGPMYPIMMNHSTSILPKWLLTGAVGYIAGIGQAGSAVLPLVTGLLASKFGIGSLQPLVVSMMSTMIVLWALVPKARRID
ncbi:hypothetical protein IEO21_01612 [Rhodonia placenta]|uniref:Major facilitator superfamily (MFS) profile domain-containing protein n=1 Tax=Rhodonia placenta TaxID=104341 RepID=A0A8H7P985_9APHY|nr:hypothetical protein IEO21_01612 [Postia placenta]